MADAQKDNYNPKKTISRVGEHSSPLGGFCASTPALLFENMHRGYIKLWRKGKDWVFADRPLALALWVNLLWEANGKPTRKVFKGKVIDIKKGQLLTGRKYLSKLTGIPEATVERYLKCFETEQQIIQETSNKNRLITIVNWEMYQTRKTPDDTGGGTTDDTTNGQQMDTPKNDKKGKNVKNRESAPRSLPLIKDYFKEIGSTESEATKFFDHFESNGWKVGGRATMKCWMAAARNWARRSAEFTKPKEKTKARYEDLTNSPVPERPVVDQEGLRKIKELVRGVTNK